MDRDTIRQLYKVYAIDFELHGYEDTFETFLGYSYESRRERTTESVE